jgi:hypothetical protein
MFAVLTVFLVSCATPVAEEVKPETVESYVVEEISSSSPVVIQPEKKSEIPIPIPVPEILPDYNEEARPASESDIFDFSDTVPTESSDIPVEETFIPVEEAVKADVPAVTPVLKTEDESDSDWVWVVESDPETEKAEDALPPFDAAPMQAASREKKPVLPYAIGAGAVVLVAIFILMLLVKKSAAAGSKPSETPENTPRAKSSPKKEKKNDINNDPFLTELIGGGIYGKNKEDK